MLSKNKLGVINAVLYVIMLSACVLNQASNRDVTNFKAPVRHER